MTSRCAKSWSKSWKLPPVIWSRSTAVFVMRCVLSSRKWPTGTIQSPRWNRRSRSWSTKTMHWYGRRNCLRVTGISDTEEDTMAAVVQLANEILKVDPPIAPQDINSSHRLPKPRNAPAAQAHPIIIRFTLKADRDRVLKERKELKKFNEDKLVKIYISEDLTTPRARLFAVARTHQKNGRLQQVCTFNGNIKVKTHRNIKYLNYINSCMST